MYIDCGASHASHLVGPRHAQRQIKIPAHLVWLAQGDGNGVRDAHELIHALRQQAAARRVRSECRRARGLARVGVWVRVARARAAHVL